MPGCAPEGFSERVYQPSSGRPRRNVLPQMPAAEALTNRSRSLMLTS